MSLPRLILPLAMLVILGVPFLLRPASGVRERDIPPEQTVVIVTPHVTQLRYEFELGFQRWHERVYGKPARVVWLIPGGTSEIVKQLQAKYNAALRTGEIKPDGTCAAGTVPIDLMFGGGSFDHTRLKNGDGIEAEFAGSDASGAPAKKIKISMSVPAGFSKEQLDGWFGENVVGVQKLYDPEQYWIGTALSGFGIVYNREIVAKLGLPEPAAFEDLCRPEYFGWIALADPRQSGSVTTTFDAILSSAGWTNGWRTLRDMTSNTRYFTNSSTKPPIDVGQGEAAAGLAIDFYGRNQSQSILRDGQDPATSRVGYVDPKGAVSIDADPVSVLRGGPNPVMARRFVEFCLSEEGQALWQFRPSTDAASSANPIGADGKRMGPERYALRRMPVRRAMFEKYSQHFIDPVNPFELASKIKPAGWRNAIGIMMGAFAIDTADEQREAAAALRSARGRPGFPQETLQEMERLFYAFPTQQLIDGTTVEFTEKNFPAFKEYWRDPERTSAAKVRYTTFFRENYERVVELSKQERVLKSARSSGSAELAGGGKWSRFQVDLSTR